MKFGGGSGEGIVKRWVPVVSQDQVRLLLCGRKYVSCEIIDEMPNVMTSFPT
jgi:hypothetical protein